MGVEGLHGILLFQLCPANSRVNLRTITADKFISTISASHRHILVRTYTLMVLFASVHSFHPYSMYQKALIANAAASALRLRQRLPQFQFSRDYFSRLLLEDSAHYMFYSIMFLYSSPITGMTTRRSDRFEWVLVHVCRL